MKEEDVMDKKAQETAAVETPAESAAPAEEVKETETVKEEVKEDSWQEVPETEEAKKIASLETRVKELEETRIRLIAEMDNLRKRSSKDLETLRYSVTTDTLYPFFQVFDHFEMAVMAAEKSDNLKALTEGMKMIGGEFGKAFSDLGIEQINAVGKDFDPNTQEAVGMEDSDTVPQGKVIRQWCMGYQMNGRLLKPASVIVSNGPAKAAEEAKEEEKK